ncbi:hypothetical protein LF1_09280 [Rubripirellula obstinata]|uniref:Uncharacterized protein n=1 Tax=Rubripirellula obstinata TaxID=406547 RepID=A0A5B1CFA0_9BACT|nr:hypothetical protein [Rubripirellula obstinata]KAA1258409.1 hypothetical protein LF1_09280 [Rubripirellula obstinata]
MTESNQESTGENIGTDEVAENISEEAIDNGPGCMPAVMAATVLMGIMMFIFCAFSTWVLYQKRTELAMRTLTDAYLPELEQSLLEPESKTAVMEAVEELAADMERGKLEDWQSAGVMQRLQRLPVLQWGDLQAVESLIEKSGTEEQQASAKLQFDRLRLAVANGRATSFDFVEVLSPVQKKDPTVASGFRLIQPLDLELSLGVIKRAELVADREKISSNPDEVTAVSIESILRAEIQEGISEGSY